MRTEAASSTDEFADELPADSPLRPAARLIARLGADEPIRRVGILQVEPRWFEGASDFAARLAFCGLTSFDYAAHLRGQLATGARFAGVSSTSLLGHLGDLTRGNLSDGIAPEVAPAGLGAALLVTHFDLALCLLASAERTEFWRALAGNAFPRGKHALLLVLPVGAAVGPDEAMLANWKSDGRVARACEASQGG